MPDLLSNVSVLVQNSVIIARDDGKICETGKGGFVLPLFADEQNWSKGLRGFLYSFVLVYFFLGVSIIADIFMGAIEVITSRRRQVMLLSGRLITVRVWNDTVANLTLMALGSSAPEILLAVTDLFKREMFAGELGPATIAGSASFNLFVIIALCIFVIPETEFRRVREVPVFIVTVIFMLFAYLWLVLTVSAISPGIIEIWEAVVTLACLPILVWVSYLADIGKLGQCDCMRSRGTRRIKAAKVNRCCELLGSYDRETKEAIRMGLQVQPQCLRKLENPTSSDMEDLRKMVKAHTALKHSRAARRIEVTRQMTGSRRFAINFRPTFFLAARVSGMTGANVLEVPIVLAKGTGATLVQFAAESQCMSENMGEKPVMVHRTGDISISLEVDYTCSIRGVPGPRLSEAFTDEEKKNLPMTMGTTESMFGGGRPGSEEDIHCEKGVVRFQAGQEFAFILAKRPPPPTNGSPSPPTFVLELARARVCPFDSNTRTSQEGATRTSRLSFMSSRLSSRLSRLSRLSATSKEASPKVGLGAISRTIISKAAKNKAGKIAFPFERVMIGGTEDKQILEIMIQRQDGCSGRVTCSYRTERLSAVPGYDYKEAEGELVFEDGATETFIEIDILPKGDSEAKDEFLVVLEDADGGAEFNPRHDGGAESEILTVQIAPRKMLNNRVRGGLTRWLDRKLNFDELRLGTTEWSEQFIGAIYVNGSVEEQREASSMDWFFHLTSLPWKLIFTFVPPTTYCSGWVSFWFSLFFIGALTAVIGDLAELFGCVLEIPEIVTAITFVALGTSMPDLFASKTAACQDPFADASIVNVTGSNSVNVFLGLGLPWTIGAIYWEFAEWSTKWEAEYPDRAREQRALGSDKMVFVYESDDIGFSVTIFSFTAVIALLVLFARRYAIGAELGGPLPLKLISSSCLVILWLSYIFLSSWWALRRDKADNSEFIIVFSANFVVVAIFVIAFVVVALRELARKPRKQVTADFCDSIPISEYRGEESMETLRTEGDEHNSGLTSSHTITDSLEEKTRSAVEKEGNGACHLRKLATDTSMQLASDASDSTLYQTVVAEDEFECADETCIAQEGANVKAPCKGGREAPLEVPCDSVDFLVNTVGLLAFPVPEFPLADSDKPSDQTETGIAVTNGADLLSIQRTSTHDMAETVGTPTPCCCAMKLS